MGYYVSHLIGIRTGGVFGGSKDTDDIRVRIGRIVAEMEAENEHVGVDEDPTHCLSKELVAAKGSYVVLAGVFNYWSFAQAAAFSQRLSSEFGVEVLHACWDEQTDQRWFEIFINGKPQHEVAEHEMGKLFRRLG